MLLTGLPHLDPPGERVLIPYEGKRLAGVLRRPIKIDQSAASGHHVQWS